MCLPLKYSVEERKKCYCLVVQYCCPLSQKWLDYVNIYCALLLVDYWKNSEKCVSVVWLRVFH